MQFPCIGLGDQAPLDSLQPDAVDMDLEDEDARERRACNFVRRYPVPVAAGNTANVKTEKGAKADRASFADPGSFAAHSARCAGSEGMGVFATIPHLSSIVSFPASPKARNVFA